MKPVLSVVLVGATLAAYGPVFHADFLNYDDQDYIYQNDRVRTGLTASNVVWALTRSHSGNWHPATWVSHMVDVEMFGLDPRGHHVTNVVLHCVNVALLFLMLCSITGQTAPSFMIAGLFALHPVNVESVAWVSQRKTLLSTLFAILAIWSYCAYARNASRKLYGASLLAFALSLASKQTFVTLPFALLLLDYWPLRRKELEPPAGEWPTMSALFRGGARLLPDKVPYAILALAACSVTLFVQTAAMQPLHAYGFSERLGNVAISYVRYISTAFWPANLSIFYPLYPDEITVGRVAAAAGLIGVATIGAFWFGRRLRYLLVGWLWFLGTFVPMIGLVHVGEQSMADRYAYSTFWGLMIATVWLLFDLSSRTSNPRVTTSLVTVGFTCLLAVLGTRTFQRNRDWKDTVSVFQEAVAHTKRNWLGHQILAMQYVNRGEYTLAAKHCEASMDAAVDALTPVIHAVALKGMNDTDGAVKKLDEALAIDPDLAFAYSQLGVIQAEAGDFDAALGSIATAAEKVTLPSNQSITRRPALIYRHWGNILQRMNRLSEALEKYEKALELEPDNVVVLQEAAEVDLKRNNVDRAIARLKKAIQRDPKEGQSYALLGSAQARQGRPNDAIESFRKAIAIDPKKTSARLQLAKLLLGVGKAEEADQELRVAMESLESDDAPGQHVARVRADVLVQWGDILLAKGDVEEAVHKYTDALAQWQDHFAANNNLAWLLATDPDESRRDPQRAIALARRASQLREHRDYSSLGTLAAACAAAGQTDQAVHHAREAIRLAMEAGDEAAVLQLKRQLVEHEKGLPYLERAGTQGANR